VRPARRWAWVPVGLLVLAACLDPAPTAVPTPDAALPLPDLHYPVTPEPTLLAQGQIVATVDVPHFRIRYLAGDREDVASLPAVVAALETTYDHLAALLGEAPSYTIPVQFEHDLQRAWETNSGIVLYRRPSPQAYADQVPHALTHIFTSYTGYPFLEEGLAVYCTMLFAGAQPWPLYGVPAGQQVAGFLGSATYTPLDTALRFKGFGKAEYSVFIDDPAVRPLALEAGAFAQFLIARDGLAAYRRLTAYLDPAGLTLRAQIPDRAALERDFQAWLRSPAAAQLPALPPPIPAAPPPAGLGPAPAPAALLTAAVQHWQAARSVRLLITKLGQGEWAAPDYLHLALIRPDTQQDVLVQGDRAYQHQPAGWTPLPPGQSPEATLAQVWTAIGAAAQPAGPVAGVSLDGRACWRAAYFLVETPDLDRYKVAGGSFVTIWFGAADGRVYRLIATGYEERFQDWDAPIVRITP